MADINYSLETLTGKHGGVLEVVETIVSDGRLIMVLTDEDVLQRRDAPLKGSEVQGFRVAQFMSALRKALFLGQ